MATRMQQRRGTAAQWTGANPILNAGEMGWESDTNKFKIGDGTNHWADLDYFIDQSSTANPAFGSSIVFEGATSNAYETTLAVTDPTADRTITFPDATGTVALTSDITAIIDSAPGALDTLNELAAAINDDVNFASTITTEIATRLPKTGGTMTGAINMGTNAITNLPTPSAADAAATKGYVDTALVSYAVTNDPTLTGTVTLPSTTSIGDVSSTEIGYVNGVTSGIQTQLDAKRNNADDLVLPATKLIIFEGTTENEYETSLTVTDPTADRTVTIPNASGTVVLHDTTQTLTNKTITGADNTVSITSSSVSDFTEAAQDAIGNSVGTGLSYNDSTGAVSVDTTTIQARVADVSDTEIGYLNGVSSAIQTQLDDKLASASAASNYAPLASPALTGTPTAPTAAAATNTTQVATTAFVTTAVNNVIDSAPGALDTLNELAAALGDDANFSTTITNSLAAKAPIASPTFTGTVTVAASGVAFTDGTQTKEGVPSRTTINQQAASYNLSTGGLTLRDSLLELSSASAITLTIPANSTTAYPVGTSIDILQTGAGQVTVAGAAGVTVNATPGLKLRAQWSSASLFKRATDTWVVMGDLSA